MLSLYLPMDNVGQYQGGHLIHRLDRKTSGLMVLAKHKEMAKYLGKKFQEREIYKAYYALVSGVPSVERGTCR